MNKKGLLYEEIIFIFLNLIFFVVMIIFVVNATGSKALQEERYAKQIALMIDEAKPIMSFSLDMQDALEIAEKNKVEKENAVKINEEGKKVTVKLGSGKGYSYNYFSDAKISAGFQGVALLIKIEEKEK